MVSILLGYAWVFTINTTDEKPAGHVSQMLVQCWPSVCDAVPTESQHRTVDGTSWMGDNLYKIGPYMEWAGFKGLSRWHLNTITVTIYGSSASGMAHTLFWDYCISIVALYNVIKSGEICIVGYISKDSSNFLCLTILSPSCCTMY